MISRLDDMPWIAHEHGELRFERQRLVSTRSGTGASLSRYRIPPGARSMPLHVHADEEELFFVLGGRGWSRQEEEAHEIAEGDVVVHRADREAHTLFGGHDESLDVLAFASGSATRLTLLPRAGMARIGTRWLPQDAAHPLDSEPPLDAEPPVGRRPRTIVALHDVEPTVQDRGPVHRTRRDLGRAARSRLSGLQHLTVAPARRSSVRHCHSHEDEIFVLLEGSATLLLGDERIAVRPGMVVSRPAATGVAHAFEAGEDGLVMLAYGTREPADTCWYPDSRKISFRGLGVIARVEPLDYWDGEE